ncbi:MAG: cupin fold metalloprotein, WbuC family [Chloroflexi bacterium]|nr:cupin fold metalloprotein, WbuC family [Chloroflexota bacterium]
MSRISKVDLSNPESVEFDNSGRSAAYFCKRNPVSVDSQLISELKDESVRLGGNNIRLCLHESPESNLHEMINLEHRNKYNPPHKHAIKGESYHIIEGSMAAFVFDDDGTVADASILEPKDNFLYRVGVNMYHAVIPVTDVIIYHETRPGPFSREGDSLFPTWAPDGSDPKESEAFISSLLRLLEVK